MHMFLVGGLTWHTGAKGNKSDGIHGVLEVYKASKVSCHISNDGGAHTDHCNGDHKGGITLHQACERVGDSANTRKGLNKNKNIPGVVSSCVCVFGLDTV